MTRRHGAGRHIAGWALAGGLLALGACTTTPTDTPMRFIACDDVSVGIYFEPNSADVSSEAKAVLRGAADQAKGCRVDGVDVLGLADAVGAPDANLKLSEQRAAAVTRTLRGYGLGAVKVAAAGDIGAVTQAGAAAPLRRRADVIVKLSPK
jgi:peptidoglycan-associated lipoprotein